MALQSKHRIQMLFLMCCISSPCRYILAFLCAVLLLVIYNEFLIYYLVLIQCTWPQLSGHSSLGNMPDHTPLKAMILADTHLIGSKEGHWFDKLRREWQMERAFQTAMMLFEPDIVFVLGDLFDEGMWCSDAEFRYYVSRFQRLFRHSKHTDLQVVVGNHDIGFHYMVDMHKRRRFASAFNAPSVRLFTSKHNHFVMLNSMAFEGDKCDMCLAAKKNLDKVINTLNCAQGKLQASDCIDVDPIKYSKPILLQHFPLYRKSDVRCNSTADAMPEGEKRNIFMEKMDCISKTATDMLLQSLTPRLVVSGHTHYFCKHKHADGTTEWTLPSFSWRNNKSPSFLLLTARPDDHAIQKCYMPCERTVITTYIVVMTMLLLILLYQFHRRRSHFGVKVS